MRLYQWTVSLCTDCYTIVRYWLIKGHLMNRREEVRALLQLTPEEVRERAGQHLVVCGTLDKLHRRMAQDIMSEIEQTSTLNQPLRLIMPVGPTGQYPYLVEMINQTEVSLAHCWFFFMDEYCDEQGVAIRSDHPLSFKGVAESLFLGQLHSSSGLKRAQVFFPDEHNIAHLAKIIGQAGGIDTCYGGIGIHGHVAFNEPEENVAQMSCRKVRLNNFTVTLNAIRSNVGGNLVSFPRHAYTLGMKEILASRHIRLYCRNGIGFDWANTVLRLALLGEPGDDYPVTHLQSHSNIVIVTDEDTLQSPQYLI